MAHVPKLRQLLIQYFAPIVWTLSKKRKVRVLQQFSLIEKDSACQLRKAIELIDDPKMQAGLFQHVLEEFRHADLFQDLSESFSDNHIKLPVVTRDELIPSKEKQFNALNFFSYVYVGEREVNDDFAFYTKGALSNEIKDVFNLVRADEIHHEQDSLRLLRQLAHGDEKLLWRALKKAELVRWYRSNLRHSRTIGLFFLSAVLFVIYFASGPLYYWIFRRRFYLSRDDQFRIFKSAINGGET